MISADLFVCFRRRFFCASPAGGINGVANFINITHSSGYYQRLAGPCGMSDQGQIDQLKRSCFVGTNIKLFKHIYTCFIKGGAEKIYTQIISCLL